MRHVDFNFTKHSCSIRWILKEYALKNLYTWTSIYQKLQPSATHCLKTSRQFLGTSTQRQKAKVKERWWSKGFWWFKKDTFLFTLLPGEVGDNEVFRAATNLSETRVYCPSDPGSVPTTQRKPAISWDVTQIRGFWFPTKLPSGKQT